MTPEIAAGGQAVLSVSADTPTLSGFANRGNVTPVDSEGPFPYFGKAFSTRIPTSISAVFRSLDAGAKSTRGQR